MAQLHDFICCDARCKTDKLFTIISETKPNMLIEFMFTQCLLSLSIKKRCVFIVVWLLAQIVQGRCLQDTYRILQHWRKLLISEYEYCFFLTAICQIYLSHYTSKESLLRKIILNIASSIQFWQGFQIYSFVKSMCFSLQQKTTCVSIMEKKQ